MSPIIPFFPSSMWITVTELSSLGLAASAFAWWAPQCLDLFLLGCLYTVCSLKEFYWQHSKIMTVITHFYFKMNPCRIFFHCYVWFIILCRYIVCFVQIHTQFPTFLFFSVFPITFPFLSHPYMLSGIVNTESAQWCLYRHGCVNIDIFWGVATIEKIYSLFYISYQMSTVPQWGVELYEPLLHFSLDLGWLKCV